jgi:hypothetical protein
MVNGSPPFFEFCFDFLSFFFFFFCSLVCLFVSSLESEDPEELDEEPDELEDEPDEESSSSVDELEEEDDEDEDDEDSLLDDEEEDEEEDEDEESSSSSISDEDRDGEDPDFFCLFTKAVLGGTGGGGREDLLKLLLNCVAIKSLSVFVSGFCSFSCFFLSFSSGDLLILLSVLVFLLSNGFLLFSSCGFFKLLIFLLRFELLLLFLDSWLSLFLLSCRRAGLKVLLISQSSSSLNARSELFKLVLKKTMFRNKF